MLILDFGNPKYPPEKARVNMIPASGSSVAQMDARPPGRQHSFMDI